MGRERGPNCRRKKRLFINNKTKQTNKQKQPRRGQTDWQAGQGRAGQGRAGQGRAGQDMAWHKTYADEPTYGNEPTRNCKHKEIIKGANEKGNEGEQLGKMYQ